ncbi:bZIP transcription factor 11-like [Senna tora]|uniref:BZIP transcription factor 11-like n=1 Tax=Senna tora TaxID=362788 RepID=A0A835CG65_9FABA|nr:bZIP transcription factor 11-like [Senna tora]
MASSSGTSSGSVHQNSGSEEEFLALMDQRKRKRMISNRESARRSRMRKQKHLDDLVAQVAQLKKENHQIVTSVSITTQQFLAIEAENSVLRAQVNELTHRLQSLNEIVDFLNASAAAAANSTSSNPSFIDPTMSSFFNHNNPLNMAFLNHPIMASADMFQFKMMEMMGIVVFEI